MVECVQAVSAEVAIKLCTKCGDPNTLKGTWCRGCKHVYNQAYYAANRERMLAAELARYRSDPSKAKTKAREQWRRHGHKRRGYSTLWRNQNRGRYLENQRAYDRERLLDVGERLKKNLRTRIWEAIKGFTKSSATSDLIGCSVKELRAHLEAQFKPEMTWDNYGSYWSVDHKKACANFDLSEPVQQRECFHFTNLQPLEKIANIRKSDS